jgi:hypothetical protein
MSDRQFAFVEGLLDFFDQVQQAQPRVKVFLERPTFSTGVSTVYVSG